MKTLHKEEKVTKAILAFKLLSDPTRYRILSMLFGEPEGLCVYEIAEGVNISHSAASHQLAKLEAHQIVESFREGQTVCYEIFRELLREARQFDTDKYVVMASQTVIDMLLDEESNGLMKLQEFIGKAIHLQVEPLYHQEQFDVVLT